MASVKFVDTHNVAAFMTNPPEQFSEFTSLVTGLRACRISHALSANPTIFKDLVREFWLNASLRLSDTNHPERIVSKVQGKEVCVTEQIIREALQINDSAAFSSEMPVDEVRAILDRMGYEGRFPPTLKKLLPPYWRFLFHTFFICFSGRKGGADEISLAMTSAIAALTMNHEFNFSYFVLSEMRSNLSAKKKEVFAMYPRFLQMIFDARYPELTRSGETYDIKTLGPNTFSMMKQTRKSAKEVFQGLKPLEMFGIFSEIEGVVSPTTVTAPISAATSAPSAIVAEEHVPPPRSKMQIEYIDSEEDEIDDIDDDDLVTDSDTETDTDTSKSFNVMTEEEQDFYNELNKSALTPPQAELVSEEPPRPNSPPLKRRKRDPRPGVFGTPTTLAAQDTTQATQDHDLPIFDDLDSEEEEEEEPLSSRRATHASGSGSSSQGPPGGDPHLDATLRLAHHLSSEDSDRPSRAGIHIGAARGKQPARRSTEETISDLEEEVIRLHQRLDDKDVLIGTLVVKISDLTKEVSSLQTSLGDVTAIVYDLKAKLSQKFGDEFGATTGPSSRPTTPAPDVTLESYLAQPSTAEERREKEKKRKRAKKGKSLVSRPSDQNLDEEPQLYIVNVDKQRFVDEFGDRSGIKMWGFDRSKDAWVVKRNSGRIEYYERSKDFMSMTKVDISELLAAPFFNPYNVKKARDFVTFLKRQAKTNFVNLNLAESFTKEYKEIQDPHTGKTFKTVMWPATKKMKKIPVSRPVPDGTLSTMEFWMLDDSTATVLIKRKEDQIRLVDPKDLLMFGELDIHTLSRHQIISTNESMESTAKEFTSMVARIIHAKMWAGSLASKTDAELINL